MAYVTGAIVAARNKKVMKRFKTAGAIGPAKAVAAEELDLRDNYILGRFVARGFLAKTEEGNYYIPEAFTQTRRWKMMFGNK